MRTRPRREAGRPCGTFYLNICVEAAARAAKPRPRMEISTMADADAEFNLRDLNDQELIEQVHDDL